MQPKRFIGRCVENPSYGKTHNPAKLTDEQIGIDEGYRLLYENEVNLTNFLRALYGIEGYGTLSRGFVGWSDGWKGNCSLVTYRTKLSVNELKELRSRF